MRIYSSKQMSWVNFSQFTIRFFDVCSIPILVNFNANAWFRRCLSLLWAKQQGIITTHSAIIPWPKLDINCSHSSSIFRELNHNHISWIVEDMSGAFHGLKQLYKLGLAGNQITSLNQNAFVGLSNLKVLDLSKNPIKTIQENAFAPMTLSQLTADTNSLLCDCAITWFYLWLSSSGVQLSSAFCAYPPKLQGQLLTSIRVEDFLCCKCLRLNMVQM